MQLPNKLYSYEESTLFLLPIILRTLSDGPVPVKELYMGVKSSLKDSTDFLSAMDCLYALRAVDLNDKGEVFSCL